MIAREEGLPVGESLAEVKEDTQDVFVSGERVISMVRSSSSNLVKDSEIQDAEDPKGLWEGGRSAGLSKSLESSFEDPTTWTDPYGTLKSMGGGVPQQEVKERDDQNSPHRQERCDNFVGK